MSQITVITVICLLAAALFRFNPAREQIALKHSINYFSCFFLFWFMASLSFYLRALLPLEVSLFTTNFFLLSAIYSLFLGFQYRKEKARHLIKRPLIIMHITLYSVVQTLLNSNEYNASVIRGIFYAGNYCWVLFLCLSQIKRSPQHISHYGEIVTRIIIISMMFIFTLYALALPFVSPTVELFMSWAISLLFIVTLMGAIQSLLLADETERHYQNSITDSLTSLYNRRHFLTLSETMIKTAKRHHYPFTIIMCDLDKFKKINDTHGHQCGDKVLIVCAQILKSLCRESDIIARYGGEEFIILLSQTTSGGAEKLAERMRVAIEQNQINFQQNNIHITASFGISSYTELIDIEVAIKQADNALYQAKANGRNNICTFKAQ